MLIIKKDWSVHYKDVFLVFQDYHWWWRSYIISGGSAVYVSAYSVFYFVTKVRTIAQPGYMIYKASSNYG